MSTAPITVEVWSDIACPWCWVGKRNLEEAAASLGRPLQVRWRAFELDPSAPKVLDASIDMVDRLARKYGTSAAAAQQMIDRMTEVGRSRGLDFRFEKAKPGNTFDAHRLLAWAVGQGKQSELKERLFLAYMHEGECVSDHDVLVRLAEEVGLDPEAAQAVLGSNDYADEVRGDEAAAARIGVRGVPFFVVEGRYAVSGAQPPEVLEEVVTKALNDGAGGAEDPASSQRCGPDGCAV